MADRPIIFSAPMVQALLDGRKTQTRRVLKPQAAGHAYRLAVYDPQGAAFFCGDDTGQMQRVRLPYAPGDRLWVKEVWATDRSMDGYSPATMAENCLEAGYERPWAPLLYFADDAARNQVNGGVFGRKRSPIHMPRWASRLTLTVTDVRVQRVQDISEEDAYSEGAARWGMDGPRGSVHYTAQQDFARIWNSIHGPDAWDANPWVAAITFTVRNGNIDQE